jgi:GalNAc-alpha-(1->4)-GalNAc-alpha-(1->3)-diNAcBac-PP-undecaprenol alpha-1,4-N-acetyl-D-galactosaminyltransferase
MDIPVHKKKIAFLIPSLQPGGMERVMSEIIEFCSRKPEVELHLVLFGIKREIFYEIPKNILIHKPDFEFDNTKRSWHTLKTIYFIRKTIKKINPNTVLSFGELWNNIRKSTTTIHSLSNLNCMIKFQPT